MKSEYILDAMGEIEEEYITKALKRLSYEVTEKAEVRLIWIKILRRAAMFIGVALLVMSSSVATVMAFNEEFREEVIDFFIDFFHIEEVEEVPVLPVDTEVTTESMYVEPERTFLDGRIEGRYIHAPFSGNAREGVFTICTDEIELNQGSRYDAYYEENGNFIKLQESSFSEECSILGNDFHISFDWVEHGGQVVLTYIEAEENYRIPSNPGPKENMMIELFCCWNTDDGEQVGTTYPVLLDLTTGKLQDVLSGTGAEKLEHLANQAISEDYTKMLLAQDNGDLYYVDLVAKKLYSVEELSGEKVSACSLIGNTLSCWVLEKDVYRAWSIDLTTFERKELFSGIPNAMGKDEDETGIVYLSGFDTTVHWGTMFGGSYFAVEKNTDGSVNVIDMETGDKIPVEGLVWPSVQYDDVIWDISPDGKRLLICGGKIGLKYEYIGVLDFEKMSYLEFARDNVNEVNEWTPYWFDKDTVIIQATDKEQYNVRNYYVYDILQ